MPPVGFELTSSAGKRPQTCALDRAATGTGCANISEYTKHNVQQSSMGKLKVRTKFYWKLKFYSSSSNTSINTQLLPGIQCQKQ